MSLKVKLTEQNGQVSYVYPSRIDVKISENASTEITLTFPNAGGLNTSIMRFDDLIEIEEEQ